MRHFDTRVYPYFGIEFRGATNTAGLSDSGEVFIELVGGMCGVERGAKRRPGPAILNAVRRRQNRSAIEQQ